MHGVRRWDHRKVNGGRWWPGNHCGWTRAYLFGKGRYSHFYRPCASAAQLEGSGGFSESNSCREISVAPRGPPLPSIFFFPINLSP